MGHRCTFFYVFINSGTTEQSDLSEMIVACRNVQLSVNIVYASFQVVLTDNLFHKLKGLDHSILYNYTIGYICKGK